MIWKGRELTGRGEWADAMAQLRDPDEAQAFRAAFLESSSTVEGGLRDLGYLSGDLAPDDGERARKLLGVDHPVIGDLERPLNVQDLLLLGMAFQRAQLDGEDIDEAAATAREAVRMLRQRGD